MIEVEDINDIWIWVLDDEKGKWREAGSGGHVDVP